MNKVLLGLGFVFCSMNVFGQMLSLNMSEDAFYMGLKAACLENRDSERLKQFDSLIAETDLGNDNASSNVYYFTNSGNPYFNLKMDYDSFFYGLIRCCRYADDEQRLQAYDALMQRAGFRYSF